MSVHEIAHKNTYIWHAKNDARCPPTGN